jgi:hypothetical protein
LRDDRRGRKGTYSEAGMPVAPQYVVPTSRRALPLVAVAAVAILLAVLAGSRILRHGSFFSQGPLSSSHANFEQDCASCHAAKERVVTDARCSVCHEKYGDELGIYSFGAHYVYLSDDFRRLVPDGREGPCFSCHVEHAGRDADITAVTDAKCLICHDFGSFDTGHPQFDFAARHVPDNSGLRFPHVHHVREVMKAEKLEDIERSCLYCHNPRPDGRGFEPIDFDRHCDACHLTVTTGTPALPIRQPGSDEPGVETLEAIVARRGPEIRWALYTDPNEFRLRGASVSKAPVHHRDPWVLENLRALRQRLYPDAGLADLLTATPAPQDGSYRPLYVEAMATLEEQAEGLRGRPEPEVQADLRRIDEALAQLRRAVARPYAALDETGFLLALDEVDPALGPELQAQIESLVQDLTEPCRQCHRVEHATIARVQKDQRTLTRAHFDHRAHIVQARCLDCHDLIPIAELARSTISVDPAADSAEIQNLPRIEKCRQCHTDRLASNACATCHYFHPNKGLRADLLLYLR